MTAGRRAAGSGRQTGLEPRTDAFSAVWAVTVVGIFIVVFALPFFGVPTRFFPTATPAPLPSIPETPAVAPVESPSPDASPLVSPRASPSPQVAPSP